MSRFICVSPVDALEIQREMSKKSALAWDDYRLVLQHLTLQDVSVCRAKCIVLHHGVVEEGMAFYLPPGFVMATASVSQCVEDQCGLQFRFMPKAYVEKLPDAIAAIKAFNPTGPDAKILGLLGDIGVAAS